MNYYEVVEVKEEESKYDFQERTFKNEDFFNLLETPGTLVKRSSIFYEPPELIGMVIERTNSIVEYPGFPKLRKISVNCLFDERIKEFSYYDLEIVKPSNNFDLSTLKSNFYKEKAKDWKL